MLPEDPGSSWGADLGTSRKPQSRYHPSFLRATASGKGKAADRAPLSPAMWWKDAWGREK